MEKSVLFIFFFIVINVCLLSTFGALAQDTQLGNEKLWGEVWKSILADNEKMIENNSAAKNSKIPEKEANWVELLQNRLDVSPPHSATVKPRIATNIDIDFKMVLSLLKQSDIELSNDQWMTFFQYVLSTKTMKSTTSTTTITPITETFSSAPSEEKTSTWSAAKEPNNKKQEDEWLKELSKMLETNPNPRRDQIRIGTTKPSHTTGPTTPPPKHEEGLDKKGIISDEQWAHLLERVMTSNDAKNRLAQSTIASSTRPSSSSSSELPHQLSTSQSVKSDKDGVSISDRQWEALLERFFNGDEKTTISVSQRVPTPTQKQMHRNKVVARENSVIPDNEWERVLQEMLDKDNTIEHKYDTTEASETLLTTLKTAETQTDAALSDNDVSDTTWASDLQKAVNVDLGQKDDTMITKSTTSTPLKTSKIDEAIVDFDAFDKEWESILQKSLDMSRLDKSGDIANNYAQSTAAAMPTTTEKPTTSNDDESKDRIIGDRQWIRLLERAMNIHTDNLDDNDSDAIGDRQWLQLLERMMDSDNLSKKKNINLEHMIRKHATDQTKDSTTQSVQEKETNTHFLRDAEWERVLQEAMDNNGHNRFESTSSKPHNPTTPMTDTNNDNTDKYTADEQWERLLNLKTSLNQEVTSAETTVPDTDSISNSSKPQVPQALSSKEKIENGDWDNKNFYLLVGFGVGSGVLLICLIAAVAAVVCRKKGMLCWSSKVEKHTTVLNSDFNRWDPQTLRPSKENMNAFLYSIPMPMKEIKIEC